MVLFSPLSIMFPFFPPPELVGLLRASRTVAVVGLSPNPKRPSHQVASYLQTVGYQIIPVNPGYTEILGQPCHSNLRSVPVPVDLVDIFRKAEAVEPIVREAIAIGAKMIWMQQGIVNEIAARIAEEAGLTVVMDRCLKVELEQLRS